MGGNKSKPLADTARKVVARRVENPNPINDISLSSSNQYPVRKDILDEMSKWPAVHTSVVPKVR